ncbi:hypothetical protein D3C74_385350 [compost metagenome]
MSPASPTSPIAMVPGGMTWSSRAENVASAMDRSAAGSLTRAPPIVETYTSWSTRRTPACRCMTARIIARRLESIPLVVRRGLANELGTTSDWISRARGLRPSSVTVMHVPGTPAPECERNSPLGSASPTMPVSERSKHPTSSVGP